MILILLALIGFFVVLRYVWRLFSYWNTLRHRTYGHFDEWENALKRYEYESLHSKNSF